MHKMLLHSHRSLGTRSDHLTTDREPSRMLASQFVMLCNRRVDNSVVFLVDGAQLELGFEVPETCGTNCDDGANWKLVDLLPN